MLLICGCERSEHMNRGYEDDVSPEECRDDIKDDVFLDECVKRKCETTSKKSKNKMKKER